MFVKIKLGLSSLQTCMRQKNQDPIFYNDLIFSIFLVNFGTNSRQMWQCEEEKSVNWSLKMLMQIILVFLISHLLIQ